MRKTFQLLLLVPLIALGDSSTSTYYPKKDTVREKIQIDKLSTQARLYDRTVNMAPACHTSRYRALYRRNITYIKLKELDPYTSKYYSKIRDPKELEKLRAYNEKSLDRWKEVQRMQGYRYGPVPGQPYVKKKR